MLIKLCLPSPSQHSNSNLKGIFISHAGCMPDRDVLIGCHAAETCAHGRESWFSKETWIVVLVLIGMLQLTSPTRECFPAVDTTSVCRVRHRDPLSPN
jgi:hypothetical protein